jgi:hypothetical protein
VNLLGRTVRYEERAAEAIRKAKERWDSIEDILEALEWALMHDPLVGKLLSKNGIRGFVFPGARSVNEPDIDVIYQEEEFQIIIHDLTFRDAKANYAGRA